MFPPHERELLVNLLRVAREPTWTQREALAAESRILTQKNVRKWFRYARNRFLRHDGIDEIAILRYRISGLSVAETLDVIERERERQRHIANEEFAGKEDYLAYMEREIERQRERERRDRERERRETEIQTERDRVRERQRQNLEEEWNRIAEAYLAAIERDEDIDRARERVREERRESERRERERERRREKRERERRERGDDEA